MSKKEKDVELIPFQNGWKVKHGTNVGTGPGNYPKVEFGEGSGPHLVVFTLPKTGNITFNPTDPMWIAPGTTSPTAPGMDPQFADWTILDGGKTLVLLDLNTQKGEFSYRVKADNYAPILDPIIKNGGTSVVPPSTPDAAATVPGDVSFMTLGIAVLVALVVGYFAHKFFAGGPSQPGGM